MERDAVHHLRVQQGWPAENSGAHHTQKHWVRKHAPKSLELGANTKFFFALALFRCIGVRLSPITLRKDRFGISVSETAAPRTPIRGVAQGAILPRYAAAYFGISHYTQGGVLCV